MGGKALPILATIAAFASGQPELAGLGGAESFAPGVAGAFDAAGIGGGIDAALASDAGLSSMAAGTGANAFTDFGAGNTGFGNTPFDAGGLDAAGIATANAQGTSPNVFSQATNFLKTNPWINPAMNIGSGILGLGQSDQMKKMAMKAFNSQDPFGSQRGQYQQQLSDLQSNPGSVTGLPGYQFGLDQGRLAIQRQGAANGSGGAEATALAKYTPAYAQQFYDSQMSRLMGLSGAGIAPTGGSALLQGTGASTDIMSRALASIGYGVNRAGGGTDTSNVDPKILAMLAAMSKGNNSGFGTPG